MTDIRIGNKLLISGQSVVTLDGATGRVFEGTVAADEAGTLQQKIAYLVELRHEYGVVDPTIIKQYVLELGGGDTWADLVKDDGWWPELLRNLDFTRACADFYLLSEAILSHPALQSVFNEFSEVLAQQVAIYLDTACGGEVRHKLHGGFKGLPPDHRGLARRDWRGIRQAEGIEAVAEMRDAFNEQGSWHGGMGGKKWGIGADVLYKFLSGAITPAAFLDMSFDLEHNNGCIFNKGHWNYKGLQSVLNAKLHTDMGTVRSYASTTVIELIDEFVGDDVSTISVAGIERAMKCQQSQTWGVGTIGVGSTVRIVKARDKKLLDWTGKVQKIFTFKGGEYAEFLFEGTRRSIRTRGMIVKDGGSTYREYIGI